MVEYPIDFIANYAIENEIDRKSCEKKEILFGGSCVIERFLIGLTF
jgi:hypothetical protein